MKSRIAILVLVFGGMFGLLIARLFYLQILPNGPLDRLKKNQYTTVVALKPQRGKIFDREGQELATSITAKSLFADPSQIENPLKMARRLEPLLKIPAKEIAMKFRLPRRFVWIKRQLDDTVALKIQSWNESGLGFIEEGRRYYPNQNLLAQVIGFVGSEGSGLEGLEKKYDEDLRGEKLSIRARRDARGRPLIVNGQLFEVSREGSHIETTIDKDLQYELERQLEETVHKQNADKALGVILDPATGEVLALGSYPGFNPVRPSAYSAEFWRNRPVTDVFEPGSTFKIVAIASALRTGRIFPNTKYFCENGKFYIGQRIIHEAEASHGYGWLSLAEVLQVSSNIGSTKIVFDVGEENFRKMISDFGFLNKTGIDLGGEVSGLSTTSPWPAHLLSNVSFGHGIGVTAIQLANAYSAVANGGKLMKPFLVKRIADPSNQTLFEKKPEIVRQVLSSKEAETLTLMLTGATEIGGTGMLAKVDGYPVAGKTGTAQKVNPTGRGYLKGQYLSSFAGFVPANNPQFTIYVLVDNPRKAFYGAQVAAPLFQTLASFALHKKGFMPLVINANSLAIETPKITPTEKLSRPLQEENDTAPRLEGLTVREVAERLKEFSKEGRDIQLVGRGVAHAQLPLPGQHWTKSQPLRVYFKTQ